MFIQTQHRLYSLCVLGLCLLAIADLNSAPPSKTALETRKNFLVAGKRAFLMLPEKADTSRPIPWVWYAPTLGNGLPGEHESWMFNRLHAEGIAIAGIDVGESYGSPAGAEVYQKFYTELIKHRRMSKMPVLLARSRGGLMLYSWAVRHPENVAAVAGIYPVCNLASYPGVARAAPAYGLTPEQLGNSLTKLNPIDLLEPLAKAKVPIFHLQGDSDTVVPLEPNSALLAERINTRGGNAKIEVIKGQGHNLWEGWFTNQSLTDFMIKHAKNVGSE
tara:strand:+ start:108126 stop:108950 length:825 start_codon:yes stop_codon:yes gene_type:complete